MDSRLEKNWKQEILNKLAEYESWFKKSRAINYRRDESTDITAIVSRRLRIGIMIHADWNLGGAFRGYVVLTSLRKIRERKTPYSFTYLLVKNLKSDPSCLDSLEEEIESVISHLEGEDEELRSLGYRKNRPDLFYPYSRFFKKNGRLFKMSIEMRTQKAVEGSPNHLEEYLQLTLNHIPEGEEKDSFVGSVECFHHNHIYTRVEAILHAERTFPDWVVRKGVLESYELDRLTHLQTLPEWLKDRIIRGDQ